MPWSPRRSAGLLALLLLVSLAATASVTAAQSSLVVDENSTNYLSIAEEDVEQESYESVGVDVSAAVAADAQRLHGEYDRRAFETKYERAATAEAQSEIAEEEMLRIENRVEEIDAERAELLQAHSNGTISTDRLLYELVRLDAVASQQQVSIGTVARTVDASPDVSLPVRLEQYVTNANGELVLLPAPVEEQVMASKNGTAQRQRLFVQAGEEKLVMVTVGEDGFTRQATLRDEYVRGAPDQFDSDGEPRIVVAFQRGAELYPWLFENADGTPSIRGFGDSSIYLITAEHPHGTTESYVDGATTNVFREHHAGDPESLPVSATLTDATDEFDIRVELTRPTGPMRVTATTPEGEPLRADITVNGEVVGTTDEDGQLWTVQPSGQFRVTAASLGGEAAVEAGEDTDSTAS